MALTTISLIVRVRSGGGDPSGRLRHWLELMLPVGFERELILLDDNSSNASAVVTEFIAAQPAGNVVRRIFSAKGRGGSLREAILVASGNLTVIAGERPENDPPDLLALTAPIIAGAADAVFASRFLAAGGPAASMVVRWINFLYGAQFTDVSAEAKAFRTDALRTMALRADGPEIDLELAAKVQRNQFKVVEVPAGPGPPIGRLVNGPGSWRDVATLRAVTMATRYRFGSDYADRVKVALDALECAPRFNRWMYETIRPWLGTRVLELGAGKGNLSEFIRQHGQVLLSDYREDYLDGLRRRFAGASSLSYAKIDMTQAGDYEVMRRFGPDTVVFLNVLEHIEDDRLALRRLGESLSAGCRVVILVPYNMRLYSEFDRMVGHFRRYQKGELEEKMTAAGFRVLQQRFFNKVGVAAWYFTNTLGGSRALTPAKMKTYNALTPLFQRLEPLLPMSGLSTIVIAEKPA